VEQVGEVFVIGARSDLGFGVRAEDCVWSDEGCDLVYSVLSQSFLSNKLLSYLKRILPTVKRQESLSSISNINLENVIIGSCCKHPPSWIESTSGTRARAYAIIFADNFAKFFPEFSLHVPLICLRYAFVVEYFNFSLLRTFYDGNLIYRIQAFSWHRCLLIWNVCAFALRDICFPLLYRKKPRFFLGKHANEAIRSSRYYIPKAICNNVPNGIRVRNTISTISIPPYLCKLIIRPWNKLPGL